MRNPETFDGQDLWQVVSNLEKWGLEIVDADAKLQLLEKGSHEQRQFNNNILLMFKLKPKANS